MISPLVWRGSDKGEVMNIPLQDNTLNSQYLLEEFSINFIGKELFYSEQTIESVQSEFGVSTHRFESIASLPIYDSENNGPGRILIVDQMLTEDFLARPRHYRDSAGLGSLVFAYRKEDAARFVFDRWDPGTHGDIGYLPMNIAPDAWRSILRLLLHEELYLPSFLANSVCNTTTPTQKHSVETTDPHPLYSKLTRREKQVLQLVSKGQSNKIIASNLGITEHTVKLHMHNVAGKIGVSNRTAAAQFFFEVAPQEAQHDN
jgi:DNA-binding CsgD family transcriptional regulator